MMISSLTADPQGQNLNTITDGMKGFVVKYYFVFFEETGGFCVALAGTLNQAFSTFYKLLVHFLLIIGLLVVILTWFIDNNLL